jgi:hypothetical protein
MAIITTIMPKVKTHALAMSTTITTTTNVTPCLVPSLSLLDVEQQRSKVLIIFIMLVKD